MSMSPTGWTQATIEELAGRLGLTTDGDWIESKDQDPNGEVRLIQLADIGDGEFRDRSARFVTSDTAHRLKCTLLQEGDLLIARMPDPLGRACIFPALNRPAITAVDVFIWRPAPGGPSAEWLMHFVNSGDIRHRMAEQAGGTTRQRISGGRVKQLELPVPPLPEQRRIVAKIDGLFVKSKRARDHLDHLPRLVEKYKQAILAAAFTGNLQPNPSAPIATVPISSMIAALDQGWSPKCESEPAIDPDDWAIIKTTAIQPIHFNGAENKKLPRDLQPRPQIVIEPDDVLITRAGPRSRVAIACVVKQTRPRLMLCDKAYRLRVNASVADATFLALMLNAPQSLETLERMKTGISDSGLNLTQAKFLDLAIPNLTLGQQQETVRRIETAFAWIDRLATETTSARKLLDHLDKAVLAKAFRGELVPQDTNDEPANVLLERIEAERVARAPLPRRGRRSRVATG